MKRKIAILALAVMLAVSTFSLAGCFGPGEKKFSFGDFEITATTDYKSTSNAVGGAEDGIIEQNTVLTFKSNKALVVVSRIPKADLQPYNVFDLEGFTNFTKVYYDAAAAHETTTEEGVWYMSYEMNYVDIYDNDNTQWEVVYEGDAFFYEVAFVTGQSDFASLKSDFRKMANSVRADNVAYREGVKDKEFTLHGITLGLDSTFEETEGSYYNGIATVNVTKVEEHIVSMNGLKRYVDLSLETNLSYLTDSTAGGVEYSFAETYYTDEDDNDFYELLALYIGTDGGYIVEYIVNYELESWFVDSFKAYAQAVSGTVLSDYANNPVQPADKAFTVTHDYFTITATLDDSYSDFEDLGGGVFYSYSYESGGIVYLTAYTDAELQHKFGTTDLMEFAAAMQNDIDGEAPVIAGTGLCYVISGDIVMVFKKTEGGIACLQYLSEQLTKAEVNKMVMILDDATVTVEAADTSEQVVSLGGYNLTLDKTYVLYEEEGYYGYISNVSGIDLTLESVSRVTSPITLSTFIARFLQALGLPTSVSPLGDGFYISEHVSQDYGQRQFYVFSQTQNDFVVQLYIVENSSIDQVNKNYKSTVTAIAKTLTKEVAAIAA